MCGRMAAQSRYSRSGGTKKNESVILELLKSVLLKHKSGAWPQQPRAEPQLHRPRVCSTRSRGRGLEGVAWRAFRVIMKIQSSRGPLPLVPSRGIFSVVQVNKRKPHTHTHTHTLAIHITNGKTFHAQLCKGHVNTCGCCLVHVCPQQPPVHRRRLTNERSRSTQPRQPRQKPGPDSHQSLCC